MPRGRKGPPQDSIDSILLAISRRDDIDPDTLSHYFDRLDEEWTEGAREKVMHLLRSSDPSAHAAAILILSELATDFDLEELEDFVTDPTISDMAKLSLSPILKELGSEMADDGIIEYLNDPATAMQQMQMRLLEMVGQSEMGVESVLEDVVSMPLERRLSFVAWLGSSNDPRATHLLIPLLENQSSKIVMAVIDALEQLGPIAAQQTIPALNYLIANNSNRSLKQHARAALGRLTMQSMPGVEDVAMAGARRQQLPCHEARVSFIDGSGAQLIMLSWKRPDGRLKGVNILFQDEWGVKDCYGVDEIDIQRWDDLVDDLDEQGFGSFEVPFAYGQALVSEARSLSKRTRHKLPIAYSIWRPLIEGAEMSDKQDIATILEPQTLNDEILTLAKRGDEVYQMPEFLSWIYEPPERVEPYMSRYWAAYN
ncbi:MAG: HEAT repeat domain-containing protein, partial [Ktedonobacteraceae bacterium]|nr:HEAT repeat domain-containing protein [Ktedonobacteraceae bacterium]